jgi:hypothetical protein
MQQTGVCCSVMQGLLYHIAHANISAWRAWHKEASLLYKSTQQQ